jgi:hypothetical protein
MLIAAKQRSSPKPCFLLRCCSKHPGGSRNIDLKKGVIWFLNLAYSYEKHMTQNHRGDSMKWNSVFGDKQSTGMMKGTVDFPAVKVLQEDVLPTQVDNFSCGIGLVAAVAIILDTFIRQGISRVNVLFDTASSEIVVEKAESVIQIPKRFLESLPKSATLPSSDYLHDSKEEWFILFDHIAHLQHVAIPRRNNPDVVVKHELLYYLSVKAQARMMMLAPSLLRT